MKLAWLAYIALSAAREDRSPDRQDHRRAAMKGAQFWANLVERLTRGAVPVDGFMQPADNDDREARDTEKPKARPRELLTTESEFDVAGYPRWGNFR